MHLLPNNGWNSWIVLLVSLILFVCGLGHRSPARSAIPGNKTYLVTGKKKFVIVGMQCAFASSFSVLFYNLSNQLTAYETVLDLNIRVLNDILLLQILCFFLLAFLVVI